MTIQEATAILGQALIVHAEDPNFAQVTYSKIESLLANDSATLSEDDRTYQMPAEAALIKYHAPYPEVLAGTDPYDDPDTPVETFRAHLFWVIWVIIGVGVNHFFEPRMPDISISASLLQLLLYLCGKLLEYAPPDWSFTIRGKR